MQVYQPPLQAQTTGDEGKQIVRVRGLPFQAQESDVRMFFSGYPILEIKWNRTTEGKHNGTCHIIFRDAQVAQSAMQKNKQHIGNRYVDLFLEDAAEMDKALSRGTNTNRWLKLRGIPFQATTEELVQFFDGLGIALPQVQLVFKQGRPSGEAIACFGSEADAAVAMQRNRQNLGARYVELIPIDDAEATLLSARATPTYSRGGGGEPGLGGQYICLRGLPFRATLNDIAKFLEGIDIGEISIRYDKTSRPSGEAFVEMKSSAATELALQRNKNSLGGRYIEVFRVDREEVARKLGGGPRDGPYQSQGNSLGAPYQMAPAPQRLMTQGVAPGPFGSPYDAQFGALGQSYPQLQNPLQVNIDSVALQAAAQAGQPYITIQVPTQGQYPGLQQQPQQFFNPYAM